MPRNNFDDRDDSADFQMNDSAESRPLTFGELGVPDRWCACRADDKKTAFPIQADTLPDSLAGRDILGRGRTGSAKPSHSPFPLVHPPSVPTIRSAKSRWRSSAKEIKRRKKASLEERRADDFLPHPRGLVLAPTRELANRSTTC